MAAKLERTNTPGIFRRHQGACRREGRCDCAYVIVWRHRGRQHMDTFSTFAEAREGKSLARRKVKLSNAHEAGLHREEPRGECPVCEEERARREQDAPTLHEYAREWIGRYQGTGRRGFRDQTRDGGGT